ASGRLETRVDPGVRNRYDEIGALGRNFDRMAEQIEALVNSQRDLLGDVSHELRSPLARLTVALGLLQHAPPAEVNEYASRIGIEAERLDKMIGQLLTLTRIDSGVEFTRRETFDLTNLVQEVVADGDFEARAREREVKIVQADSCTMSGFPEMLRSAIENVVRNAIRYAPSATAVEVSLDRVKADNRESAVLRIREHGQAVSPRLLTEIFKPFHRATSDGNANGQGAGLGLAIAERVVRRHDGTIRAYNASNGGLVVEIALPIVA